MLRRIAQALEEPGADKPRGPFFATPVEGGLRIAEKPELVVRRSVGGRLWVTEELEQKDPRGASPGMALAIDRSLWARDGARDACADCMQSFGVFLWKHHCRFCGEVFCDACSTHRFPLAREGREADLADERVCNDCYQELCSHRQSVLERRWEDHAEEGAAAAAAAATAPAAAAAAAEVHAAARRR